MKHSRSRLFLILAAVTTLGIGLFILKGPWMMTAKANQNEFRVGFPFSTDLAQFDPARVQVAGQYALLENLYSPLLQQDNQGRIVPGVAKKFYWVEDEIEFQIREDLVDSGGVPITVEDVYFSLMRLLVLGTSTHGDLQKLICSDHPPKSIDDTCNGIRIVDGKLRLKPTSKNFSIFKNFTSIDFAIVPKRSVKADTLDQIDLSITSGPYFIKEKRDDGSLALGVNKNHFLYSETMPQKVVFVPTLESGKTGLELFESNQIDFLSSLDQTDISERISRYQHSEDAALHSTLPVRLELLVFTERGMLLPPPRRWALANKVAKLVNSSYSDKAGHQPTLQYFPEGGAGSLHDANLGPLKELRSANGVPDEEGEGIIFGTFPRSYDRFKSNLKNVLGKSEVVKMAVLPAYDVNTNLPSFPHLYIVSMDTGFLEDFPNVTNAIKSGFLGLDSKSREEWLARFIHMPEDDSRLEALRSLHLESLMAPVIVPVSRSPYVSLVRKPWRPNFSYLFPNCPVWKISID